MESKLPGHARARRVPWVRVGALALVLAVSVTAALPLYWYGVPQAFDTPIHLARFGALDAALRQGEFYPRWLPNLLLGHGYPVFNYYAPAAYYVAVLLLRLSMNAGYAYLSSYALFLLVAGLGMYHWARDLYGRESAAVVAATAYVFAPYLLLNTYVRGSFAETCAMALLPWVFWAFRRLMLAPHPPRRVPLAALTLAALAVSHNITLLLTPPVLAIYLAVLGWRAGMTRGKWLAVVASLLLAMGVSAGFWLPVIVERGYLSDVAYGIARNGYLPGNVWQWDNFWQRSLTYIYNDNDAPGPVQVSVVQVVLAAVGFALALTRVGFARAMPATQHNVSSRTRGAELALLLVILVMAGLGVGAWALPVWQSHRILAVVQFPWRLLVIMGLPLALAVGGIASAVQPRWARGGVALAVMALVIYAHYPRLNLLSFYDPTSVAITLDHVAQIEQYKGAAEGGENTSSVQEFKPRWAARTLLWVAEEDTPAAPLNVVVEEANGWSQTLVIDAQEAAQLRLNQFYFPGWHGQRNGQAAALYPSSNLGLLTVDLAAGRNTLVLRRAGTWVEHTGVWITLLALVGLMGWCWRQLYGWRLYGWLTLSGLLLLPALVAALAVPPGRAVTPPRAALAGGGLELVGVRAEQSADADALALYPIWYVRTRPADDLRVRWQVTDAQGAVVADWRGQSFYNSYAAANFPLQTVVEDGYRLALPGGVTAGSYALRGQLFDGAAAVTPLVAVGEVTLRQSSAPVHHPAHTTEARFTEGITLAGYDVDRPSYWGDQAVTGDLPVVASGGQVELTLWWQADAPPQENFHGFVHLVDSHGTPVEQVDQLPGPVFQPPMLWNAMRAAPDVYDLYVPAGAASGLYWPWAGLYHYPSGNRLPVVDAAGAVTEADHVQLGPVKVVNRQVQAQPAHPVAVEVGDFARWLGYDLMPAAGVQPGESVTVTLYYEAIHASDVSYTRFVHVVHPTAGLVTQADAVPQGGANPTWTWQPDEVVVDPVVITLPQDAPAGEYDLLLGFYAPERDGVRARLQSEEAARVKEGDQALIGRVVVE